MSRPPNAFELAHPASPLPPLREGKGGGQRPARARRVNLAPRTGSFHITNAEKSRAQALKTEQIRRGTISVRHAPVLPPRPLGDGGGEGLAPANGPLDAFDRGTRAASAAVGISASAQPSSAPQAGFEPPQDLHAFVQRSPVRQVADALGMSRGTAHNLKRGYWPVDPRKLLAAWDAYRGRLSPQQSGWFLRRVQAGGCIHHAGGVWSAPTLAGRDGQTLAVARVNASTLLAQTLELPSMRFVLTCLQV